MNILFVITKPKIMIWLPLFLMYGNTFINISSRLRQQHPTVNTTIPVINEMSNSINEVMKKVSGSIIVPPCCCYMS